VIGGAGAYFGYDLARGSFLGLFQMDSLLHWLNRIFSLGLLETWDSSISASMVLMMFFFFCLAWVFSPKYGLVSTRLRRRNQKQNFKVQVLLAHIHNHEGTPAEKDELAVQTLHTHFHWPARKTRRLINQLRTRNLVYIETDTVRLTSRGENKVLAFRESQLARETVIQ
jgi:manganese/zinc/iron transport system permease protein